MRISTRPSPTAGLRLAWQRISRDLFEREGLDVLFTLARNLLTGTVIVAAGLHAVRHQGPLSLPGAEWTLQRAGWLVLGIGVLMLVLNLVDGLRRLARRHNHLALRLLAIAVYLGVTVRLTQVIVLFRYGM